MAPESPRPPSAAAGESFRRNALLASFPFLLRGLRPLRAPLRFACRSRRQRLLIWLLRRGLLFRHRFRISIDDHAELPRRDPAAGTMARRALVGPESADDAGPNDAGSHH